MKVSVVARLLLGGVLAGAASRPACGQTAKTNAAATPPPRFVLLQAAPAGLVSPTAAALQDQWSFFSIDPKATPAFTYFVMPMGWHGDSAESQASALTFSFLLASALEWHPTAQPAVTAVNLPRLYLNGAPRGGRVRPTGGSDFDAYRRMIGQRRAGYIVGGELSLHDGAYAARIEILATNGVCVYSNSFPAVRDYFGLVGEAAVAVLHAWNYEASPALRKRLSMPRCRHFESVIELGAAMQAPSTGSALNAAYARILERDAEFAEVRDAAVAWGQLAGKKASPIDERTLTPSELRRWDGFWGRPKTETTDAFDRLRARIDALAGADSPLATEFCLRGLAFKPKEQGQVVRDAIATAARHPASVELVSALTRTLGEDGTVNDPALAASILLACSAAAGDADAPRRAMTDRLGRCLSMLGYDAEAAYVYQTAATNAASARSVPTAAYDECLGARALSRMGQFALAAAAYGHALNQPALLERKDWVAEGFISAVLAGRNDLADVIRSEKVFVALTNDPAMRLALAYEDAMKGNLRTVWDLKDRYGIIREDFNDAVTAIPYSYVIDAEMDLRAGTDVYRQEIGDMLRQCPDLRPLWILFDAYDRRAPDRDAGAMYATLLWLHGNDPWVREAAAARARREPAPVANPKATLAAFRLFPADPWPAVGTAWAVPDTSITPFRRLPPGAVTAAVKTLLDRGDTAAAQELVLRALRAARGLGWRLLTAHLNYVYHRVEQAKAGASKK